MGLCALVLERRTKEIFIPRLGMVVLPSSFKFAVTSSIVEDQFI